MTFVVVKNFNKNIRLEPEETAGGVFNSPCARENLKDTSNSYLCFLKSSDPKKENECPKGYTYSSLSCDKESTPEDESKNSICCKKPKE
ncbi:MAG: hypothetical protein QXI33_01375 [Candidatus Pacearchaeota archaeon]